MHVLTIDKFKFDLVMHGLKSSANGLNPESAGVLGSAGDASTLDTFCIYVERLGQIAKLLTEYKSLLEKDMENICNKVEQIVSVDSSLGNAGAGGKSTGGGGGSAFGGGGAGSR